MITELESLRPEVRAFALRMEQKLRERDYRGGWQEEAIPWLLDRLFEEVRELVRATTEYCPMCGMAQPVDERKQANILMEAVDVANFAMFVADVAGGLLPRSEITRGHEPI